MKAVILLCLVAMVMADDVVERQYGKGYDDIGYGRPYYPSPRPYLPRPFPGYGSYKPDDYYYPEPNVYYKYNIRYPNPYYQARQGKEEYIDYKGTRGSYFVDEPYSDIFVKYDFPRSYGRKW